MRAKVLKINELNINKHSGKPKVKCFKSRTTLIRYRWRSFKKTCHKEGELWILN